MSEEQIKFILAILKEQDEKRKAQIKGIHKHIESGFDAFSCQIKNFDEKIKKIINVDLEQEIKIKKIEKETSLSRFMHRNPKLSIFSVILILVGLQGFLIEMGEKEVFNLIKKILGL